MITKKFVLLDIDYITKNREAVIRLFGRVLGEKNQQIIALDKSFKPYMYVIPLEVDVCVKDLRELGLLDIEKVFKNDKGKMIKVLKITLNHPQDIPKLREKVLNLSSVKEIREHDIPFYRRYLIDKGLSPMNAVQVQGKVLSSKSSTCIFKVESQPETLDSRLPDLKVLSFDIEAYNPHGMPQSNVDPIIMISFSSNQGLQKVLSTKESRVDFIEVVTDERELLEKFVSTIQTENPDIILGYNLMGLIFLILKTVLPV